MRRHLTNAMNVTQEVHVERVRERPGKRERTDPGVTIMRNMIQPDGTD
jgi:hypothetical protein